MSVHPIQITTQDAETLRQIENDFNRGLWAQLDGDERNYQLFEQNMGLRGRLTAAFYALGADIERARGHRAKPHVVVKRLSRAFDAMLPSLKKSFGEAALIKALPDTAMDARVIAICKQVGAKGLAGLCEKKLQP